ncbi:MAG: trypsin-like peptidase domain-containing protein [Acidimicrobiales bacterium]
MRHTRTSILAAALLALTAAGFAMAPGAQAATANCTPDAVTTTLNGLFGGPAPVGTPYTCTIPVHPGARIDVAGSHGGSGGGCTANFVFRGSDGRDYLGTAGHCTLAESNISGDVGEFADANGAVVKDANGRRIGQIAYAIQRDPYDFALIRLDTGIAFDKALPHWGAPTGTNTSTSASPTVLNWVGHGTVIGDVLYARSGLALGTSDPNQIAAVGLIAPGDSGGPVVDSSGRAVGVNVALGVALGTEPGVQFITRIAPQLARATALTGVTFTLA